MKKVTVSFVMDDEQAEEINFEDSTEVFLWLIGECWYAAEFGIDPIFTEFKVEKVEVLEDEPC